MTSRMGSTKLHELLQEKWDRVFKRHGSTQKWAEYLEDMGFKTTKITYAPSKTPEGHPAYMIRFPDHEDVFFVLDPLTSLHLISIPKDFAMKVLALGFVP